MMRPEEGELACDLTDLGEERHAGNEKTDLVGALISFARESVMIVNGICVGWPKLQTEGIVEGEGGLRGLALRLTIFRLSEFKLLTRLIQTNQSLIRLIFHHLVPV